MRTFPIRFEPFVAQWLTNCYGSPVKFPPQSVENATIRLFLQRQPEEAAPSEPDAIPVCLPDSKAKPTDTFCYLSPRGRKAVVECVEDNFKISLWHELNDLSQVGCSLMATIYSWCEMHGVAIDHADTIRQRYYRMRSAYAVKGAEMRKKTRARWLNRMKNKENS